MKILLVEDDPDSAESLSGLLQMWGFTPVIAHDGQVATAFTQGKDRLACMSLSDKGMLRWYTTCCNTPIGNTMRNSRFSSMNGYISQCLTMPKAFNPTQRPTNTVCTKMNFQDPMPLATLSARRWL